mgnify:CR=1 FL=1
MRRKASVILFVLLVVWKADMLGVPACPRQVTVNIDGRPVPIRLFGDEYCHWAETSEGYTIVQNSSNQWCYAVRDNDGALIASSLPFQTKGTVALENFLKSHPKHLRPDASYIRQQARVDFRQAATASKKNVVGDRKMLIILMAFNDRAFSKSAEDFQRLFNEEGYSEDGAQGSVRDFYNAVSYGQLKLTCDVYGPYTASQNMKYYGRNEGNSHSVNAYSLFEEAITCVAQEADLSAYDGDGDGYLDNVHIIFAGYGEEAGAEADAIWSHEQSFHRPVSVQGMKIDRYSCSPELRGNTDTKISRIGVCCHEIGHALGAMDFYDTDYEDGGDYEGTGEWDVMASGSYNNNGITPADFNPYVKAYNFGWISPRMLPAGEVTMQTSNDSPDSYYILQEKTGGDFYMLENRQRTGWGMALPGAGLLIYHIHPDIGSAGNSINATTPQMCYIVCASSGYAIPDGTPESYGGGRRINSTGCPYPGFTWNTTFNANSTPAAFWWTGDSCHIDISDIRQNDDYSLTLTNMSKEMNEDPLPEEKSFASLFYEGFEDDSLHITTPTLWQIKQSGEAGITAHEGEHFLLLSAQTEYLQSVVDNFELTCDTIRNTDNVFVKGFILSSGLKGRKNTLSVGFLPEDGDTWQFKTVSSSENDVWDAFEVELPSHIHTKLRIEGSAVPLSRLAIDDIEVVQVIDDTDNLSPVSYSWKENRGDVFTLFGQRIRANANGSVKNILEGLPTGLYILNNKKVIVK